MITTDVILKLLEFKHEDREWATFKELPNGTGLDIHRRLDFFALNIWPSKKFQSIGYEIKVSRADFTHELARPEKRSEAEKLCNCCYFVTPCNMVRIDEIPEGWGLYEVDEGGLKEVKAAKFREIEPYPMSFVAAIARRSCDEKDHPTFKFNNTLTKKLILLGDEQLSIAEASERLFPYITQAFLEKNNMLHRGGGSADPAILRKAKLYDDIASTLRYHLGLDSNIEINERFFGNWLDSQHKVLDRFTLMNIYQLKEQLDRVHENELKVYNNWLAAMSKPCSKLEVLDNHDESGENQATGT